MQKLLGETHFLQKLGRCIIGHTKNIFAVSMKEQTEQIKTKLVIALHALECNHHTICSLEVNFILALLKSKCNRQFSSNVSNKLN